MSVIKGVVVKTSAPTVNDDGTKGYYVGFSWVDSSTDTIYTCADNTTATAVWVLTATTTSNEWHPPAVPLGSVLISGGSNFFINGGAGVYLSLPSGADSTVFFNDILQNEGLDYDGSDLAVVIRCRLSSNGGGGDTVGILFSYALTNVAQVDYDVSSELQDIDFTIELTTMTGVADAKNLMFDMTRNSLGGGSDSYGGSFEIVGLEIIKK
jgi:hypothetical protein